MRWLQYEQTTTAVSVPLLVVLVFWLTVIFFSFGLFTPCNATVLATLFICALSVSGAILLGRIRPANRYFKKASSGFFCD